MPQLRKSTFISLAFLASPFPRQAPSSEPSFGFLLDQSWQAFQKAGSMVEYAHMVSLALVWLELVHMLRQAAGIG